jgi:hypothetical protein
MVSPQAAETQHRRMKKHGLVVLLAIAPTLLVAQSNGPHEMESRSRYRNELPNYRFYNTAKWRELIPGRSTMADVRRILGDSNEANDVSQYTKPYPGDLKAKKPVFRYTQIMPGWEVLVYFAKYCFRAHALDPKGDRLCSIDLIPKNRVPFTSVRFPSVFTKSHVIAADAAWYDYTAADGLRYSVYTTRTPYGEEKPGDLNRISYAAPQVQAELKP